MNALRASPSCIDDSTLADFNTGRISDPLVESRVADHLGSCDRCDGRLRRLPVDSIVALLQAPDPLESLATGNDERILMTLTRSFVGSNSESTELRPSDAVAPKPVELPVRIDRYFVVRQLGSGGFANVYLAKDPEQNRLVAIKAPRRDRLADQDTREQFLREARTVAVLDHPHIVPMYDCREIDDGQCIVVMRYVEGETLRAAIAEKPFSPRRAAEVTAQVADALGYAHQRRVRHLDVKPANILLDGAGTPYLADFGLAIHEHQHSTEPYSLAGTYPYMSPEQLYDHPGRLDGRTDLWSLGAVLYEMLTGKRPFRGTTIEAISEEIRRREPDPLPTGEGGVPEELARICRKCLAKNREERYATAAELASDLRAFLAPPPQRRVTAPLAIVGTISTGLAVFAAIMIATQRGRDSDSPTAPQPIAAAPGANESPGPESPASSGPRQRKRRLLDHDPRPDTWVHQGTNRFDVDKGRERLTAKHSYARGFLNCGETESQNFQARFVVTLEDWRGQAGFFWGMQEQRDAFPNKIFRCFGLILSKQAGADELIVNVEQYTFEPSVLDNTKLHCSNAHQLASSRAALPAQNAVPLEITIESGKLAALRVNGQSVDVTWTPSSVEWSRVGPAGFGFLILDGAVTVENASLEEQEEESQPGEAP